jgi:hypothetical protein
MSFEILSPEQLEEITGKKRFSAQADWFRYSFNIDPVLRHDGSVVITQTVFEELLRKRMGVAVPPQGDERTASEVMQDLAQNQISASHSILEDVRPMRPADQHGECDKTSPDLTHAIDLRQAAALLGVSYGTVYAHKEKLGFFQVGASWRIWPDRLREAQSRTIEFAHVEVSKPSLHRPNDNAPRSPIHDAPVSARKAAAELDKIISQIREKRSKKRVQK